MANPQSKSNPEVGTTVVAGGIRTNIHDRGDGPPVVLIHGSGPGVSSWANWRLNLPVLAEKFRVVAPDIVGFGYTERPRNFQYVLPRWRDHLLALLDEMGLEKVSIVGNSFGGALALSMAAAEPSRIDRMVLMGSAGISFPLTKGLDDVWGYEPSVETMRRLLDMFVYDKSLLSQDLAEMRYQASIQEGFQESFAAMFPEPRQESLDGLVTPDEVIQKLQHETLIVHGRDDQIIPLSTSLRLLELIERSQLHVFGRCGHWVQIEHAARFTKLVTTFIEEGLSANPDR